jgi:hypothetical protein
MGKAGTLTEDQIQQNIVSCLSALSRRHDFIFFAVLNEAAMKGRSGRARYALVAWLKKMGMVPGTTDLVIIHRGRSYLVEVKTARGQQSENQKLFAEWARGAGARYVIVRSIEEMMDAMRAWNIIA